MKMHFAFDADVYLFVLFHLLFIYKLSVCSSPDLLSAQWRLIRYPIGVD